MGTKAELIHFLQANPPAETFTPYCYFSKEADALNGDIVGCRIKGISELLEASQIKDIDCDIPGWVI